MDFVTLNNGVKMPTIGLGVFLATDLKECENAVYSAIKCGYRLIDTAEAYDNETAVGEGIKRSEIDRSQLFVTSKAFINSMGYDNTMRAFERTLKKLSLDYLDLYLIHQPYGDYYGSWRAMTELYQGGLIKSVGVSNFFADRLVDFCLNNELQPMVNQVEMHPFYQKPTELAVMKRFNVVAEAYSPLARGRNNIFSNQILSDIAKNHSKTISQVVLKWLMQRGVVVIPKSVHKERIEENFNVFDFVLSENEMQLIAALDENMTYFNDHRNHGFCERIINDSKKRN